MKVVKNDRELRVAYEILDLLNDGCHTFANPERLAQTIIETKRAIRLYTHREVDYDRRIIKDDGMDGYISLERLPDDIRDLEEANRFFERFMTHEYQPSMYDCTGQAITNWFKVFPRNGGFYAYHSVSFDV